MSLPLPVSRRVTAGLAALVVTAGGLFVATRAGAAPDADGYRDLRPGLTAGSIPRLDPSLQEAAGRRVTGRSTAGTEAAPERDRAGRIQVQVEGDDVAVVERAVRAARGEVVAAVPGLVQAAVPAASLAALAGSPGVRAVHRPQQARTHAVTSEGVARSGSAAWQAAGAAGAGVTIGIVDVGFAGLSERIAAGDLPAGLTIPAEADFCNNVSGPEFDPHGTQVAEMVHDMAPAATLVLACADTTVGFSQAADYLADRGVSIANASLGFPLAGRGDGSGIPGSPADTVRRSRLQDGLLWVVSAGNEAQIHFGGRLADPDGDGWANLSGTDESAGFDITSGLESEIDLQWDAWPRSNVDLDLIIMSEDRVPTGPDDPAIVAVSAFDQAGTAGGAQPWEAAITLPGRRYAFVGIYSAPAGLRFDMYFYGTSAIERATPSGSVAEPATSPYALAVGAACAATGVLQPYSSQGPTIDGRVKPDITGFDAVSQYGRPAGSGCTGGFLGTSAASPHVAGAAAQLLGANPGLDAAELQGLLERKATAAGPVGRDNLYGTGLLQLGEPGTAQARTGQVFTALPQPVRVLDTRTALGAHQRPFASGEQFSLPLRGTAGVPADASAVVLTLTGTNTTASTYLSVYPQTFSGTSTLNLAVGETAANLATATLAADGSTVIRNDAGQVNVLADVVGYYRPTGGETFVARPTPGRILDTRTTVGGHKGPLAAGEAYALPVRGVAGVPADATAAVLTVTGTDVTAPRTYLAVYPTTWGGTSTVNLLKGTTRAGLAITGIGADGKVRVLNNLGTTHVVVDLAGWYVPSGGGKYVPLAQPTRYLDTRSGTGLKLGQLGAAEVYGVPVAGVGAVPYDASALAGNLTGTASTVGGYLSAYPAGIAWPGTSTLNLPVGRTVPNAVQLKPGSGGAVAVRNSAGGAHAILDVTGYFTAG